MYYFSQKNWNKNINLILLHIVKMIIFSALVVVTAMAGYAIAPGVFTPSILLGVTLGTSLTSASANAVNQVRTFL